MEISINWVAVLVAAVVNIVVGSLWYGPIFGRAWKHMMGITDESMRNMRLSPMQAMVGGFITAIVMAYVLAHFVVTNGAVGVKGALELSFWIWLGFMATVTAGSFLWENRPFKLFVLNAAQQLVSLVLMAIVIVMMM